MIRVLQVIGVLSMVLGMNALAAARYTISRDAIAAAVRDAGMHVTADQVTPLADVVSSVPAPHLRVRSVEPGSGAQSAARIECVRASECLPFIVTIHGVPNTGSADFNVPQPYALSASQPTVRTGSVVVLYLDSGRVHIAIPVICLNNGVIGQTVRATSADRTKTYMAQVVDRSSLKGTF